MKIWVRNYQNVDAAHFESPKLQARKRAATQQLVKETGSLTARSLKLL